MNIIIFIIILIVLIYTYYRFLTKKITLHSFINNVQKKIVPKKLGKIISKTIYRPGLMTIKLKQDLNNIITPLINKLNCITGEKYIIHEYDIIILEKDTFNNKKYIVDFFIFNTTNYTKTRLITEIIIDNNKSIYINYINISNAKYLDKPTQIKSNNIHNIGTNFVIKSANVNDLNKQSFNKNLIGIHQTNLENSNIRLPNNNGIQDPSFVRNPWIEHITKKAHFPCRKVYNKWDIHSNHITDHKTSTCQGLNSSAYNRKFIGNYNPTIHELPRDNFGLKSMFDLSQGIPSFPTATGTPSNKNTLD